MDNFIFSLNVTFPVFLVILIGYVLGRIGILPKAVTGVLDKYVFKVALPFLLFQDISTMDLRSMFHWDFVLFCMGVTTLMFAFVTLLAVLVIRDRRLRGAFAQASARGSAAILGIAFVNNIYGNSAMTAMMIVAAVPLYNIYSVIILTFFSNDVTDQMRSDRGRMIRSALRGIITNPIILGILSGVPFALLGVTIPTIPAKTIASVAQTATPIALLSIGASFEGAEAINGLKPTLLATSLKLVIIPAIFLPFAIRLGFVREELVAILIMLAAPTTVSCYIMAKNMGNDAQLSASTIVLTTLLSSVTLTLWIFLLRSMGLI